jgi:phosphatidylglycerol:prolipoprotein diacylglycerol transferase
VPFVIDVDPVAVTLAGIDIRWYGLILVVAITAAYVAAAREAARLSLPAGLVADGAFWVGAAALAGGRVLYILQNPVPDLAAHPAHILMVWMGGLSFYGGLIAGLVALVLFARRRRVRWLTALDVAAPAAAVGQAIGHVGCLIGGDSYGIPTDVPWAIVYRNPNAMAPLGVPLHPAQAYEALALAGLFVALWLLRRRLSSMPGALAALYLGGLAIARFALFFLRDEPSVLLGLKTAQWIGLGILAVAACLLIVSVRASRRTATHPIPLEVARS